MHASLRSPLNWVSRFAMLALLCAPLSRSLGTRNPRFVVWPLELGLVTRNTHWVVWPLELGLGTRNARFVA